MLVILIDRWICRAGPDRWIGEPVILILIIVLVERNDQKTIVSFRPLVVAIEVLRKPGVTRRDALSWFAVVYVVIEVRNNEGNGRQLSVIGREVCESQVARSIDCRPVRDIRKADPGNMLTAIDTAVSTATRRIDVNLGADSR